MDGNSEGSGKAINGTKERTDGRIDKQPFFPSSSSILSVGRCFGY